MHVSTVRLPRIILASGSPRRSEILTAVGWAFDKQVPSIDEAPISGESARDYVARLAVEKAQAVSKDSAGRIVLGADTTVVVDGEIIGKPEDLEDARRMIKMLAGRSHEVLTGIALVRDDRVVSGVESTTVTFSTMTDDEIDFLAVNGDPLDKAGAYAVQAQAALFIEGIEGDYWNVVGLPIGLVYRSLKKLDIK